MADRRGAEHVGRHARLELRFASRGGRTVLAESYAEPPFRVGRCFPEGAGLHMIMVSSAPGTFGGDCLQQTIHVDEGARVRLTSQSALQVHASSAGTVAALRSAYFVAGGGELSCHWDPLIPFAESHLDQQIQIQLAPGGRLYWSDAFMAGRDARGERWRFASLAHALELRRAGSLDYLERYRLEPHVRDLTQPWIASGACYFGTTLVSGEDIEPDSAERLHGDLTQIDRVRAAADALDRNLLLVRLMASEGVPFHAARALVRDQAEGRNFRR